MSTVTSPTLVAPWALRKFFTRSCSFGIFSERTALKSVSVEALRAAEMSAGQYFCAREGKEQKIFIYKCYLIKAKVMRRLFTRKIAELVVKILAGSRWLATLPIFRVECLRQLICSSIAFIAFKLM